MVKKKKELGRRQVMQKRRKFARVFFTLAFLLVVYRLILLQVIQAQGKYAGQVDQFIDEVKITAPRGNIYDANHRQLVGDSTASIVSVVPYYVDDPDRLEAAIVEKLGMDPEEVRRKIHQIEDSPVDVTNVYKDEQGISIQELNPKAYLYENKSLQVIPDQVVNPEEDAKIIASILDDVSEKYVYEKLTQKENSYVKIKNKVDYDVATDLVESQKINKQEYFALNNEPIPEGADLESEEWTETYSKNGIYLSEDKKRYYTNGHFSSHVLGFTDYEHNGMSGIEQNYNSWLKGEDGVAYYAKDASGTVLPSESRIIKEPHKGKDLNLTLDSSLQALTEKELKHAVTEWKAKSGTAIVMDSKTGGIMAMATIPDYDLNQPFHIDEEFLGKQDDQYKEMSETDQLNAMWKNPAVSFVYEPGSTFKAITAASALEEGVVNPDTKVHCNGYIVVSGITIKCTGNHGTQTVSEAVANSCNPGMVQIIQHLDPDTFYQYAYNFGYGKRTEIELPGEESGIVNRAFNNVGEINDLDYSTFSFGQGLATTPVQMLAALNCVINDGYYMKPSIVAKEDRQDLLGKKADSPKQLISADTSREMRNIMEQVVQKNPQLKNQSQGYRIGGKTGTAEKYIDGAYSSQLHVTSFFCYAPVDDPKYAIIVLLDEPSSDAYGGTSAAPVAISLMKQALDYSGDKINLHEDDVSDKVVMPDLVGQSADMAANILKEYGIDYKFINEGDEHVVLKQSIEPKTIVESDVEVVLQLGTEGDEHQDEVIVPDLKGMSIQGANELLQNLDLRLRLEGTGFAVEQSPNSGEIVKKGTEVSVKFSY